jgi:hypothetical protein
MGRGYRSYFDWGDWAIHGLLVVAIIAAATAVGLL